MTPTPPCRPRLAAGLASVTLGTLGLAGCDRGGRGGDTATFCADVADNVDYLRFADFQNLDQVDTIIDLYTKIGDNAPLEIEADGTPSCSNCGRFATPTSPTLTR